MLRSTAKGSTGTLLLTLCWGASLPGSQDVVMIRFVPLLSLSQFCMAFYLPFAGLQWHSAHKCSCWFVVVALVCRGEGKFWPLLFTTLSGSWWSFLECYMVVSRILLQIPDKAVIHLNSQPHSAAPVPTDWYCSSHLGAGLCFHSKQKSVSPQIATISWGQ